MSQEKKPQSINIIHNSEEVKSLIKGVGAAPEDMGDPDRWLKLMPGNDQPALVAEYKSLKATLTLTEKQLDLSAEPDVIAKRVEALRDKMKARNVDGFIVPRGDEFQGEYVPASSDRLAWATGFTGSAGISIIFNEKAAFFTDGRYTLQAREQVPASIFDVCSTADNQSPTPTIKPTEWIEKNMPKGSRLGFDPWLHTPAEIKRFEDAVKKAGGTLVPVASNPLDEAWKDRPALPISPAVPHPIEYTGKESSEKRKDLAAHLKSKDCAAVALTLPEDIAWLLNIRGNDVPCTPFALSYALAYQDGSVDWFIDRRKLVPEMAAHLGKDVRVHDLGDFVPALEKLGQEKQKVLMDPLRTPVKVETVLKTAGATIIEGDDPCQLPKAIKNKTEIQGMINAHIRDGAALTRFLSVMSEQSGPAKHDELSAGELVRKFRSENEKFRGLSFESITGAGGNGAIVHYRSNEKTNKPLLAGPIFLLDSGAQYADGTTDVTRAIAVDTPTQEMKENFTRVLIGHIRVAMSVFPKGTTGDKLDAKARSSLKEVGLDYAHGTGHGVGCYLSVHEGPCGISPAATKVPLQAGMVISNEPGYYKAGEYGIRIENLVLVEDAGNNMLKFKSLTMAPIDRNLIEPSLMSEDEIRWLNDYHTNVRNNLKPILDKKDAKAAKYLVEATEPIYKGGQSATGGKVKLVP